MVEAVNGFGEWGGRTVSPHPHAHSTMVDFTMVGKNNCHHSRRDFLTLPTTVKNSHALVIRVLSIAIHFHAEGFLPIFFIFTHRILLDLPTQ